MNNDVYDFGLRLKTLRIDKGFSQVAFADKLGVAKSVVAGYESGEKHPSFNNLRRCAIILGCTSDYLLGLDDKVTLDITGLTQEQIESVKSVISEFRKSK